jgi:tRNA(Ile)-lysidine synthase
MLQKFKQHINESFSFIKEKKLLIACSGGVDSMVLTHLCAAAELTIALAHCNFGLRGKESDGDAEFVKKWAVANDVACFIKHFDVEGYLENHGGSVQMAARELRYQWFAELLDAEGFDYVLTAHHADDNLETFLINLSRGTGIAGLTGIPQQNDKIVRPLLPFSQDDILGYAKSNGVAWREDSSNASSKYLRNKIRHQIVPVLKELHPTFLQNFRSTQKYLGQTNDLVSQYIQTLQSELFEPQGEVFRINIAKLKALKPLGAHLYHLFQGYGFTEWDDVEGLVSATSGKQVVSKTHILLKDRDYLLLSPKENRVNKSYPVYLDETPTKLPIPLKVESVEKVEKEGKHVVFLDKKKLNPPLLLRNWEKGDYFYPFGMQGKKKLSKFFKDEKMDVLSKGKQWLLCSGDDIVWVVGKRADERFKVGESTREIIKITQLL